ncbi:hypothetical protein DDB_G0289161 [Dictyostelium discoideum AX4]|uniref:Acyl-coenzyme A thioesterase 13 n=1 Tax=Dictyostelium discoideum TaxID=44689 RepID=Q54HX1_DICDI|nr:hypothetical protein DDB_G0289161 [Dictyostelium discoideum AX4]EAL62859.1 hypothetical protein DDB_G0289161 [Dictyostelium discoideum AX4]|eukprot:XP_636363.1 hypothetical protein DDB_G0289161 [Dictyostelium discoideum AX4]
MSKMIIKAKNKELSEKLSLIIKRWSSIEQFDTQFLDICTCESYEKGRIVMSMVVEQRHCNGLGTLHGGSIATLIDVISTFAIISTNLDDINPGVSVELSTKYSTAAPVGSKIFIVSSMYRQGRNIAFTETTIYLGSEDSGLVVAKGSHTKFLPIKPKF